MTERNSRLPELLLETSSLVAIGLLATAAFPSRLRKQVREEQAYVCDSCNEYDPLLEVHHKIPQSRNGVDEKENAVGLCHDCHMQWDDAAIVSGIIYPGVSIDEVPPTLFKNGGRR